MARKWGPGDVGEGGLSSYDTHKDRARERNREMARSGRDIGPHHPPRNPELRAKAEKDFKYFCGRYFAATFYLPWSPDHLKVIAKIEQAVLDGGLFAMAMPRGSGKTSLCEAACLWALLYGHRRFVAIVSADERLSSTTLDSIKTEIETNDLLDDDFHEVTHPVRALEGIHQRANGQLADDVQTHIGWTAKSIVLPTMPLSKASGSVINVSGITGRIRGMKQKCIDGTTIRPDLVLIDDPQTDESAFSPSQCATRERILAGAILGLAGPDKKIAGLLAVTIVTQDDMAARILDRQKHPQWQGERTKLVYEFPKNEKLWAEYGEIWRDDMIADMGFARATAFYVDNREAMDVGSVVAWKERKDSTEISAIQHAMNLKLQRGEPAFWAEYQNEPLVDELGDAEKLTHDQIAGKTNGMKRGVIPIGCTHLTAFEDVHAKALYWTVTAWEADFTGYIVDYGTEPEQSERHFQLRDVRAALADAAPRAGMEGAIFAGLGSLTDRLLDHEWQRDDGAVMRIDRCLIDANWGKTTDLIYQFCRQSKHAAVVLPSHGKYVGAGSIPFAMYRRKRGDRVGLNWRVPLIRGNRQVRHAIFDTNYWKSFVYARLSVAMGDPGCLSLFGKDPDRHRLIADHLRAEYSTRTEGRGRTVDEWSMRPEKGDNHWFDCLVGCAVAASMHGTELMGRLTAKPREKRRRVSLAEAMGRGK